MQFEFILLPEAFACCWLPSGVTWEAVESKSWLWKLRQKPTSMLSYKLEYFIENNYAIDHKYVSCYFTSNSISYRALIVIYSIIMKDARCLQHKFATKRVFNYVEPGSIAQASIASVDRAWHCQVTVGRNCSSLQCQWLRVSMVCTGFHVRRTLLHKNRIWVRVAGWPSLFSSEIQSTSNSQAVRPPGSPSLWPIEIQSLSNSGQSLRHSLLSIGEQSRQTR